jgi:pilus assembly protein CpaE
MKKTLTVLLIEDSEDYANLVRLWLSLRDIAYTVHWAASLKDGLNRLRQGGIDVILLDLGLPDSNGLDTFTRIRLHGTGVPVLLLSADHSEQLALQTVLDGAQDFIVKQDCDEETLPKAIQFAVVRAARQAERTGGLPGDRAPVICVMGVQGGVGTTTMACNLAVELCRQTGKKTLLVDLDLESGMVGFQMNAESKHSVLDAARNVDRLDASFWESIVAAGSGDVDVLASPSVPGVAPPDLASLQHLLSTIRKMYSWIVVDVGRLNGFSLALLDSITDLILVTTTSVPALYEARRVIAVLQKAGIEGDRLKLIVNQLSKTQQFFRGELDEVFGVPVHAKFSAAGQELHHACVKKHLPGEHSDFSTQMARLARKMAGLPEKPKNIFSRIFSPAANPQAHSPLNQAQLRLTARFRDYVSNLPACRSTGHPPES